MMGVNLTPVYTLQREQLGISDSLKRMVPEAYGHGNGCDVGRGDGLQVGGGQNDPLDGISQVTEAFHTVEMGHKKNSTGKSFSRKISQRWYQTGRGWRQEEGRMGGGLEVPGVSQRLRRSSKEFWSIYSKFEGGAEEAAGTESMFSKMSISVGKTNTSLWPTFSTLG